MSWTADDELVSQLADEIENRDMEGHKLSPAEKAVFNVWGATGAIDNGGFQFLYGSFADIDDVARAYDKLGFSDAAKACRKSKTAFP